MDWHFFFLGFFFSSSTLDTHKESAPFVADWFYLRRCCILSTNWLLDGPVVCLQFLSVTAQAACLFTHVFLGSRVLIALKEFMGVIIWETLIFIRRQTLLGGVLQTISVSYCFWVFILWGFGGSMWVSVFIRPERRFPLLAWKWNKNQLENMLRFPFVSFIKLFLFFFLKEKPRAVSKERAFS